MDQRLLEILCCPQTRQPLHLADDRQLVLVNQAIGRGEVREVSGKKSSGQVEGLLVRQDGQLAYAIRKGIPDLLKEDGLLLDSLSSESFAASSAAES